MRRQENAPCPGYPPESFVMKRETLAPYRRMLKYIRPYRNRLLIAIVASIGVGATNAGYAGLIRPLVDKVILGGEKAGIWLVPAVVIGLALFKGVVRYLQEYCIRTTGQLAVMNLRNDLYSHLMRLSMRFYSGHSSGNLMSRVLNDINEMQRAVSTILVDALRESISLVALTAVAFYQDWQLASVAFLVIPLSILPGSVIGRKIKNYSLRGQKRLGTLTAVLQESLAGIKVIKACGREAQGVANFQRENDSYYQLLRKTLKYDAITHPVVELLSFAGMAAVLAFGLQRILSGSITEGQLFSFIAAMMMMFTPMKKLTRVYNGLQRALGAAERVFEVLDEVPEIADRPGATELPRVRGDVEFDDVCFAYGETPVVCNLSLRVRPGEVIALVGPSGGGKSTLAGLLNRFFDPDAGTIRIDGHDISRVTQASLKANLAMVDQETFLFNDTIRNNIRFGNPAASDADVERALRLACAEDFTRQLPEGLDTFIGDRGTLLSGGQRQRLCIARAIVRDAPLLVLDEATSALDTESETIVQRALTNLMRNRTTFVIAHRLSTVLHADRIVVLDQGRVCEEGSHSQLLARGGLYKKLYDLQFAA